MEELLEKDFIVEKKGKNPFFLWLGMGFFAVVLLLIWAVAHWVFLETQHLIEKSPFLRVNNRDYSLFLWQHTEYMRPHVKEKTGYLPGFRLAPNVTPKGEEADAWVAAPPELLFEYHAWKRLLSRDQFAREISPADFRKFLEEVEEWRPQFWKRAPLEYRKMVEILDTLEERDLRASLPREVQQAFLGWKNYFHEGSQINAWRPTWDQIDQFLEKHPHYARHYWRNLYPAYLYCTRPGNANVDWLRLCQIDPPHDPSWKGKGVFVRNAKHQFGHVSQSPKLHFPAAHSIAGRGEGEKELDEEVPLEQIPSFLRVALFNFYH